ncbi:hypothetical protein BDY19DRAFT_990167 [Irpex rosettiformis]|uniref:Uncharacterized protein n=1 Tax=Irpex rosettiformis TaxID=378272 RepID=A0ACB8UDY1_9APHY|nr:hypothetical protein BDY19DRAFT_990167 [Irpex rosettiformis]
MRRSGPPRLNRFPQRLDYTLIPAPLDLSLPLVDEKAALPAIIVTPSSPIGEKDFSIAFLAPQPRPTFRERVSKLMPAVPKAPSIFHRRLPSEIKLPVSPMHPNFEEPAPSWSFKGRACTTILLAVLVFIMGCHLLLHSLAVYHPRLNYGSLEHSSEASMLAAVTTSNLATPGAPQGKLDDSDAPTFGSWFNLHALWDPVPNIDGKRSAHFIISEEDYDEIQTAST